MLLPSLSALLVALSIAPAPRPPEIVRKDTATWQYMAGDISCRPGHDPAGTFVEMGHGSRLDLRVHVPDTQIQWSTRHVEAFASKQDCKALASILQPNPALPRVGPRGQHFAGTVHFTRTLFREHDRFDGECRAALREVVVAEIDGSALEFRGETYFVLGKVPLAKCSAPKTK